jgi:Flp pilus assembly protein CpaB
MKAARIVVLTVAVAAGGIAALLAGRSEKPPEPKAEVPKFDTVDILVAKSDVPRGQTLTPADVFFFGRPGRHRRPAAISSARPIGRKQSKMLTA